MSPGPAESGAGWCYDVAVIGGGVVGCAVTDQLTQAGYRCCLVEKEPDLVTGASSGNSGQIDYFTEDRTTTEYKCFQIARKHNDKFFKSAQLPFMNVGGLVIACNEEEIATLHHLNAGFKQDGFMDCEVLDQKQLRELEPNLTKDALAALTVTYVTTVDPWLTAVYRAHRARMNGAQMLCSSQIAEGMFDKQTRCWELQTSDGRTIRASTVVNCGGLYGDQVEGIIKQYGEGSDGKIEPRKGQFLVYDKAAGPLVRHVIAPLPSKKGRGIAIFPTVYNNLVVGPTSTPSEEKMNASTDQQTLKELEEHAHYMIPELKNHKVMTSYAGLRPATQHKDYQIQLHKERHWISSVGIRSSGVSANVGIGHYITDLVKQCIPTGSAVGKHQQNSNGDGTSEKEEEILPCSYSLSKPGYIDMDGHRYKITHCIPRVGITTGTA